jgi:hypothetical protein
MDAINSVLRSSFSAVQNQGRSIREQEREQRNPIGREIGTSADREESQNLNGVQGMQGNINTENNVSSMFSYMNNSTDATGAGNSALWGSGTFAGASQVAAIGDGNVSDVAMQVLQSAQNEIDARSAALSTEIAYGEARGLDVTDSLAAMVNLSENREILEENLTPAFAVPGAFEGSIAEQVVAASEEPAADEMSIAAQIARQAQSEYAASIDITNTDSNDENVSTAAAVRADSDNIL